MFRSAIGILCFLTLLPFIMTQPSAPPTGRQQANPAPFTAPDKIFGYRDPAAELQAEKTFLAVPDPKLAKQHLQILTAAPHVAGSPEDRRTAEYVLQQYLAAGLDASIQPYKVWMALPLDIRVDVVRPREW